MSHPERIGKYPIVRTLGEGAMGVVYEAFDPVIRRPLAIKTIRRALIDSESSGSAAVARFKTEAQAAGSLAHPGIASVYEYGEDQDCAYIAMEFVSGNTLREYISRQTRFAEEDVLAIMTQLLEALGYAHSRKILHRDIKPANLMITRDGRLKVTDFGIARIEANGATLDGGAIGTPGYMAPEQFGGEDVDLRVDLYAAAASLYQMLTGRLPFTGSLEQVMYKTVMTDPTPPSQVPGAEHWAHLDAVILRGMAKDREHRFESAAAFQEALIAAAHQPVGDSVSEHTLIMDWVRPDGQARHPSGVFSSTRLQSSSANAGTGMLARGETGSDAGSQSLPSHWDPATLAHIESKLAHHIGPLAKVLVRRAARETSDLVALRERLAAHLASEHERQAFLGTPATGTVRPATPRGTIVAAPVALAPAGTARSADTLVLEQEELLTPRLQDRALRVLTARIGPIARVLVKRAAQQAGNRREFFTRLCEAAADSTDPSGLMAELQALPADD